MDNDEAVDVCQSLQVVLGCESNGDYQVCLLSPSSQAKYYAFFVKDPKTVVPMQITGPNVGDGPARQLGGSLLGAQYAESVFEPVTGTGVIPYAAPLATPDLPRQDNSASAAVMPGRAPALAMFYVPDAAPGNEFLSVLAHQLSTPDTAALKQINAYPFYSLLHELAPGGSGGITVNVRRPADTSVTQSQLSSVVIVGGFGIDIASTPAAYDGITGLGAAPVSQEPTRLCTYGELAQAGIQSTEGMAVAACDTAFLLNASTSATPLTATNVMVPCVPEAVRTGSVSLGPSVQWYAELDPLGLSSPSDTTPQGDLVSLLTGNADNDVVLAGSLAGARLVSDHEPVLFQLNL